MHIGYLLSWTIVTCNQWYFFTGPLVNLLCVSVCFCFPQLSFRRSFDRGSFLSGFRSSRHSLGTESPEGQGSNTAESATVLFPFCSFLSFRRPVRLESACSSQVSFPEKLEQARLQHERKLELRRRRVKVKTPADDRYYVTTTKMFKRLRSNTNTQQAGAAMDSQHRVDKSARLARKGTNAGSVRDPTKLSKLQRSLTEREASGSASRLKADSAKAQDASKANLAPSPIVTLTIGREGRLFAAHEDVLLQSPFFEQALKGGYLEQSYAQSRRIALPDEEPEVFSAVLEYLYKGDYYPRLLHNKHRNSWELEDSVPSRRGGTPNASPKINSENTYGGGRAASSPYQPAAVEATLFLPSVGHHLLRDTVVYCAAERYGLEELKRLALRKQGLQSGIDVGTILRSAQYCYAHTPDSDSRLRAHYLALIIRCRKTFKRSGTLQAEMEKGGEGSKLYFDLFVAMCNHLDDVIEAGNKGSPRTI